MFLFIAEKLLTVDEEMIILMDMINQLSFERNINDALFRSGISMKYAWYFQLDINNSITDNSWSRREVLVEHLRNQLEVEMR